MHTHMSLFEGDTNAFHSADDPQQLSDVGKSFIAGILEHANEISAVTNQWVNSYKRLVHGGEAPDGGVLGGAANRSALVRVPMYTPHKSSSRRVEVRSPRLGLQPVPDVRRTPRRGPARHREELRARPAGRRQRLDPHAGGTPRHGLQGAARQPGRRADRDGELGAGRRALGGEHVFDFFLRNKRAEWENYRSHVTPFELKTYLSL